MGKQTTQKLYARSTVRTVSIASYYEGIHCSDPCTNILYSTIIINLNKYILLFLFYRSTCIYEYKLNY